MKRKKILVAMNMPLPNKRAYGIQIAQMCEAFSHISNKEVVLVIPGQGGGKRQFFDHYSGVSQVFNVETIHTIRIWTKNRFFFYIDEAVFTFKFLLKYTKERKDTEFVFTRNPLFCLIVGCLFPVVLELHGIPKRSKFLVRASISQAAVVVLTTTWKKELLVTEFNVDQNKLLVLSNGVNINRFAEETTTTQARKALSMTCNYKYIGYVGHLYKWKGIDVALESLNFLGSEYCLVVVGGNAEDIEYYTQLSENKNVVFVGHVPHKEVSLYMKAMDILLLPLVPENRAAMYEASPLKLFEYMAAKRPVIASDLPSIREVVTSDEVYLVTPNDPEGLSDMVERVLEDRECQNKVDRAYEKVLDNYTLEARAQRILSGFEDRAQSQ